MSVMSEDLERIVSDVWRDVLAAEAVGADDPPPGELTGTIQITGAFRGAVILSVPRAVAAAAAAAMFAMDPAAVGEAEERDAIGELTNMVGGHVKAMVPGPSQLALPAVVPGPEHCLHKGNLQLLAERAMQATGGRFLARVMEDVG